MNRNILHWSYRDFRAFPEDLLEQSESVEEIYLKENFIPSLPQWFFQFSNLKFIHLGGNLLEYIPDEICLLENLEFLDISKNKITKLPNTFKLMKNLKRFNCCDNKITELTKDIGEMQALETLDFSKNLLRAIPVELSNCQRLNELLFNDNQISEIPTKIITLPKLEVFEADRCYLDYLPGIVSKMLSHVRIFNNTRLTHYPIIYERYLRLHYDYWSENVVSADQMMVFLPDEIKHQILPRAMAQIFSENWRTPLSLYEFGLRSLYKNQNYYKLICNYIVDGMLPSHIKVRVQQGPVTLCGNELCEVPLFTESYFYLFKKNKSSSHIIFSNMFCSMDCSQLWLQKNKDRYHKISWKMYA